MESLEKLYQKYKINRFMEKLKLFLNEREDNSLKVLWKG